MLLSIAIPLLFSVSTVAKSTCKCLPGQKCWPSAQEWSAFDKSLTYPTTKLTPLASPCYENSPNYNAGLCKPIQENFNSAPWRAKQPNAVQFTVWEQIITNTSVYACNPEPSSSSDKCYQGRVSYASVNATSVQDIQATVRFATEHNLKLVVRNSGHETLGRSTGIGALSLFTHNLNNIVYNNSWVPWNAPKGTAPRQVFTIEAGVSWGQLYAAANKENRTVPGGIGAGGSVGASGGWIAGGGHSILSPYYGLGVDNALQFTVVLPNASHVIANSYVNPDLFWAIRGGGGPSFGIITTTTYLTHPQLPITAAFFTSTTNSTESRRELLGEWTGAQPAVSDAGWAGFWPYDNQSLAITLISLGSPPQNPAALSTMQSFYNKAAKIPGVNVTLATFKAYPGFYKWYDDNFIHTENGIGYNYTIGDFSGVSVASGSRLIPRDTFSDNGTALANAIAGFPNARPFLVGGGVVTQVDANSAAVTPAWRKTLLNVALGFSWPEGASAEEIEAIRVDTTHRLDVLRELTPTSGAYLNEGDILEPDWQQSYWGRDHYTRLLKLKKQIDPDDLLVVFKGVNSEKWDDEIICRND